MNEIAPFGCVTCYDALDEIISDERPSGYFPLQWEAAFVSGFDRPLVDDLTDFDVLRMMRAARNLRQQLQQGLRVACLIVLDSELKDLGPLAFGHKDAEQLLVKGLASFDRQNVEVFIRENDRQKFQSQANPGSASTKSTSATRKKQVGRPNIQCDVEEHLTLNYPKGRPSGLSVADWRNNVRTETRLDFQVEVFRKARVAVYGPNNK